MNNKHIPLCFTLGTILIALLSYEAVAAPAGVDPELKLVCPTIDINGLFLKPQYTPETSLWFNQKDDGTIIESEVPGLFSATCGYYQFVNDLGAQAVVWIHAFWEGEEGNNQIDCHWEKLAEHRKYFLGSRTKKAYIITVSVSRRPGTKLKSRLSSFQVSLLSQAEEKATNCTD